MQQSRRCVLYNWIIAILIAVIITVTAVITIVHIEFTPDFCSIIEENAKYFEVDSALVYAIVKAESGFNSNAMSQRGARGLMQLMPDTARWIFDELGYIDNGIPDFNTFIMRPEINILLATGYLKYLIDKFDSIQLAIIAYNAGEGRLARWLEEGKSIPSDIPYKETQMYYKRVTAYARVYRVMKYNKIEVMR